MLKDEKDPDRKQDIRTYIDIYEGGQEITLLSRFLAANQRTAANTDQVYKFLNNFESAIFQRENKVFSGSLSSLKDWVVKKESTNPQVIAESEVLLEKHIKTIIENSDVLKEEDAAKIKSILEQASNIRVSFIDKNGERVERNVSLLAGDFDFRYYIDLHKTNDDYRRITRDYYNLIKNTINVFDVIQTVPHFKAMIDGVIVTHQILLETSYKYNSVFNIFKDAVKTNYKKITIEANADIKNQFGNSAFAPAIKEREIKKVTAGLDMRLKKF
jgi:hypothetical protein